MSEINKRIEALEAELQKLKNEVKEPKVKELELNKWYKSYISDTFCFRTGNENNYGILSGDWYTKMFCSSIDEWTPATHQEVEKALIKEAKKRGFKKGVMFKTVERKGICNSYSYKFKYNKMNVCIYESETVLLNNSDGCIFCNGVWAEIVKDEPIKIGGYSVEKIGESYRVGCKRFEITDFIDAKRLIEKAGVQSLRFESIEINIETINKILAL